MGNFMKKFLPAQTGSALVLVSLSIALLMGVTGLVIDGGVLYTTKSHLQKTARAAVLSGAQELSNDVPSVENVVQDILLAHQAKDHLSNLTIDPGQQVSVTLRKEVSMSFMKILGFHHVPVEASATAKIQQMGRAQGAAPLGIDEAIPLEFNKEYKLKVDQTEVSYGNFGVLALSGPGAQTYEENLRFGYRGEIKIGDIIDTQTGNIAGKTRTAIDERITNCSLPDDLDHRDCSRILLVPVYRTHNHENNQLKQIKVTGFAYFYIKEPMSPQDTSITGMFIKRVGTGYTDFNALDKGAYSIKLTE
ncbi:MAG: hypothetical protein K0R93_2924 [Anaerosolibacter sp.]|jgi:hypothetical protein|uniref:TadE/TadG family type IV pilus assembly protein n=1 Tax=Anaerosolibacter sp. TaxID=1872527 RepID=UPI00262E06AD|nr:Tad domain-containing protein [Anaerosolibacter sp.]MDF2548026.1 hypothetical protein [Anaerosolibacter sp.]